MLKMLQDEAPKEKQLVSATFKTTRLISSHSIENVKKHVLDVRITHRFGEVGTKYGGGASSFFGLDNAANIRLALEYGITDRLAVAFGRSKFDKALDGHLKYKILWQTEDNKMPLSLSVFANAVLSTNKTTPYQEKFSRRMSYSYQFIVARKFNEAFSLQLMGAAVHRNYVSSSEKNDVFAAGIGMRVKVSKRSVVVLDYYQIFDKNYKHPFAKFGSSTFYMPLGIGYEIETGGHVFSINWTNASGLIENHFIAQTSIPWSSWGIKLGFNISRNFTIIKPKVDKMAEPKSE